MTKYYYQAITENGSSVSGSIDAESTEGASSALVARGYIPQKISDASRSGMGAFMNELREKLTPVRIPELILFTKQLRTLIRAGVPMLKLLQVLENQTENIKLKRIIVSISQDIREGGSLYDGFRKYPAVFSPLYCSMLHAGETSGALPEVLDRLIYILDHDHKIRSDIRSALQYPVIVMVSLVVAFLILLTMVIPKFAAIFLKSGLQLPLPTLICIRFYAILAAYWPVVILLVAAMAALIKIYLNTDNGKFRRDRLILHLPLVGEMVRKAAMARFASIFAILQSSGISVLETMSILSQTINNAALSKAFATITERLEEGRGIAGPLATSPYFTPIIINMVAIGEESGNLDEMLHEAAGHYDAELEFAMKRISDSIGPILTVCLAAVVLFFALAIYLPMWDLVKMVK
ncbi:general secretion pathway protein GspF [Desulfosarcina alkanivorans]|jgi:type IV pilus assembly protein PilC|uniref:General secretion pathway protein GspF n=1 Tax=Desulfosarcina alkanivorans TaxID=571177 RepID=A0A5K7YJN3_9BACT|nr:type II secretion system F family protein [Desulfosarcina alkanivorans]BBO66991.1 general secretion pathway protein GspF [Desulfosarcina alkanivorans]